MVNGKNKAKGADICIVRLLLNAIIKTKLHASGSNRIPTKNNIPLPTLSFITFRSIKTIIKNDVKKIPSF